MANDRALTQEELKAASGVVAKSELLDHVTGEINSAVRFQAALTRLAKVKAERDRLREEVERLKCPACIEVIESRNRSEAERDRLRNQLESHKAVLNKMPKALNAAVSENQVASEIGSYFEIPSSNPPSRLCMITVLLDESGIDQKQHVIVAGHAGTREAWESFAPAWAAALGAQRKRLHMRELRWSEQGTRRLLARLGPVPASCGLVRVIGGVRVSDYEDLIVGTQLERFFAGYMQALFVAALHFLFQVPADDRAQIILEHQGNYLPYVNDAIKAIWSWKDKGLRCKDGSHKLSRWTSVKKDDEPLIDQADYLAYAQLQQCRDPNSAKAKWCSPIFDDGQTCGEVLSREQARSVLMGVPEFAKMLNRPTGQ